MYANRRNFCLCEEIGAEEQGGDVTFKTGREIWLFSACAVKHRLCNTTVIYCQIAKFSRIREKIGIEEHDGDLRFKIGSGNMAVSYIPDEKMQYDRYYRRSSVIVDFALGQIPRSIERIFTFQFKTPPLAKKQPTLPLYNGILGSAYVSLAGAGC